MDLVGRPPGPQSHQRMDAARVVADHPAQSVVRVRRGIGREGQAVLLGLAAELVEHACRAGLGPAFARGRSPEHLVEVLGPVDHDGDVAAAAGQARAAAARQDRRPMSPADVDRGDHIVDVPWDHDADRHLAIVRAVRRVQGAAAVVEPDLAARSPRAGRTRSAAGVDEQRDLWPPCGAALSGRRRVTGRGRSSYPSILSSELLDVSDGIAGRVLTLELQARDRGGPGRAQGRHRPGSRRRRRTGARCARGRGSTPGGGTPARRSAGARAATGRSGPRSGIAMRFAEDADAQDTR